MCNVHCVKKTKKNYYGKLKMTKFYIDFFLIFFFNIELFKMNKIGLKIYLNVYDLSPINYYLHSFGLGAYHSGV